jgi:flagellar motor switch protein FliM
MLVVKLKINLAGTANDCHVVMPLSMLAPVQAKLEASGQGSLRQRERFHQTMRDSLQKVKVSVRGNLVEVPLTLRDMLSLLPGDVIPVDLPSSIGLNVEDVPVLYGRFGKSRGMDAVCIAGRAADNDQESH